MFKIIAATVMTVATVGLATPAQADTTVVPEPVHGVNAKTSTLPAPSKELLTAVTSMAKDPSGYDCDPKYDAGSAHFTKGRDVWTSAYVFYRYCHSENHNDNKNSFVEPTHARVSYNIEGDHIDCSSLSGTFTYLEANFYYWRPTTGANWNPPGFNIDCDESTMNSKTQYYDLDDVPRLYFDDDGTAPKWKCNLTKHRVGWDQHKSILHFFNP